jgi:hypothetical protein
MRLDDVPDALWRECFAAACGAAFRRDLGLADPVKGATMYLNVEETRRLRGDGTLPPWAADPTDATKVDARLVTAVIGRHTFLRAR